MRVENAPRWRPGEVIDGLYEVIQLAGMGGMGQVHRVRHRGWDVELAVKVPHADALVTPADLEAFVSEAEAWVSLGLHPNICCCHYVRRVDGVPMVFAEYVPGGSLQDWIADGRLYAGPADEVLLRILDVAIQFAWGLDHAHRRGLVHQDVKPANVLLDPAGGAAGVKVTDFGLARVGTGRGGPAARSAPRGRTPDDVSVLVSRLGWTPAYASPEQAAGRRLGRRTDVYSYAVTVLEMFAGERLWTTGPDAGRALAGLRAEGPARPGPPPMPPALASVIERCLRPDPAERPDSMMEIAAEIAGLYRNAASSAYPRTVPRAADLLAGELTNRAVSLLDLGRHDEAEDLFALALAADPHDVRAAYNAGLARWRRGAATDDELLAEIEAIRADTGDSRQARHVLARIHLERGDLDAARTLLDVPAREDPDDEVLSTLRLIRSGEITDARCVRARQVPWPPRPPARDPWLSVMERKEQVALALTPDGRFLAAGRWDGRVEVWNAGTGRREWNLRGHRRPVHAVDLSPDGRFAVSVCEDEQVRFWELAKGRFGGSPKGRLLYACPDPPSWDGGDGLGEVALRSQHTTVRLARDARLALYADLNGTLRVWDTHRRQMRTLDEAAAGRLLAISSDGRRALSVGWRGRIPGNSRLTMLNDLTGGRGADGERVIRVWDLAGGRGLRELAGGASTTTALCLSADGGFAAVGCHDGTIRVWDVRDGRCIRTLRGETAPGSLSLSIDGRVVLSGGRYSDRVHVWDVDEGRCLRSFPAHPGGATVVQLDAEARSGLSAGQDRTVRMWALPGAYRAAPLLSRPRPHTELSGLGARVDALVAEAGRAREDGRFRAALDLLDQARAVEGYERSPRVMSARWALGRCAVRTNVSAAWSARAWQIGEHTALDLSADGRIVASGYRDGTIRLWDAGNGSRVRELEGHKRVVQSVCLSADGRKLLSASQDREVRLWDVGTGDCERVMNSDLTTRIWPDDSVSARFDAYERHAVVAGPDNAIRLWDLHVDRRPREVRTLYGAHVKEVCLSDDGRLATVLMQGQAALWDIENDRVVRHLRGSFLTMEAAAISADGSLALAGDFDGRIRVWESATERAIRAFQETQSGFHTVRMTADGRFAVSGGYRSYTRVWNVHSGRCVKVLDGREKGVLRFALTPDGRFVLAGHADHVRLWELDWDLAPRDPADWDDGAEPYLRAFLRCHASWTDTDLAALLRRLQDVGYGWLRPDAVRGRLETYVRGRLEG